MHGFFLLVYSISSSLEISDECKVVLVHEEEKRSEEKKREAKIREARRRKEKRR